MSEPVWKLYIARGVDAKPSDRFHLQFEHARMVRGCRQTVPGVRGPVLGTTWALLYAKLHAFGCSI